VVGGKQALMLRQQISRASVSGDQNGQGEQRPAACVVALLLSVVVSIAPCRLLSQSLLDFELPEPSGLCVILTNSTLQLQPRLAAKATAYAEVCSQFGHT
jgi:hypothetical protein